MITHVVVFWVEKSDPQAKAKLLEGCQTLLPRIPVVQNFRSGFAVPSPRGVVDDSFSVAISMDFADQTAADAYQTHELHVQFVNDYVKPYVKRLVIYDWA
jgi:hypothetical protein